MRGFKVGYQIYPQHCTINQIREAYKAVDALGTDTVWVWDHMYPLYGDSAGAHYASTPILAAMAVETQSAMFGALVASNTYRNPEFYTYEVATLVAEYADMWNTFPPVETWRRKNAILNEWCAKVDREPKRWSAPCH